MEYSEEMVKVFTSIAKSWMSYVAHFKGGRCRYVVALTNNGSDRSYKWLVEQIKQFDSYSNSVSNVLISSKIELKSLLIITVSLIKWWQYSSYLHNYKRKRCKIIYSYLKKYAKICFFLISWL